MAQNTWINVTLNLNAANIPDKTNIAGNVAVGAGSAAGNFTASWDSAVVTNLNSWDSCVAAARARAIAAGLT
jgi:hypothetical protein